MKLSLPSTRIQTLDRPGRPAEMSWASRIREPSLRTRATRRPSRWRSVTRTPPSAPLPERLAALQIELEGLLAELRPAAVAVERVFFQTNVRTAMSVGQASGLALAAAVRAGIPVCQYTPNEVKQAVAGYGAAGKAQVQAMVARLLHLPEVPKPPDAADALALAICHLSAGRFRAAAGAGGAIRTFDGSSPPPAPGLARAIAAATARDPRRERS